MANAEIHISETAKAVKIEGKDEILFYCPGCGSLHSMTFNGFLNECGATWTFNGNYEKPTLSPSLLVTWENNRCHSLINNGMMQFLGDCTHENKNKTLEIPSFKSMK